jgi:hypothetical protein
LVRLSWEWRSFLRDQVHLPHSEFCCRHPRDVPQLIFLRCQEVFQGFSAHTEDRQILLGQRLILMLESQN